MWLGIFLRWGNSPGPPAITRVHCSDLGRGRRSSQRRREMDGGQIPSLRLLASKREGFAKQCRQTLEGASDEHNPTSTKCVSTFWNFDVQNHNKFVFKTTKFVIICGRSNRELRHQPSRSYSGLTLLGLFLPKHSHLLTVFLNVRILEAGKSHFDK